MKRQLMSECLVGDLSRDDIEEVIKGLRELEVCEEYCRLGLGEGSFELQTESINGMAGKENESS